jgi:hypothetical protein
LVARTLNIFEDDLRSILADEWKRRPSGAAGPACGARLPASEPRRAHQLLSLQ